MQRPYDPLTFRYARTSIQAFGCDCHEAVAFHKMKRGKEKSRLATALCYIVAAILIVATVALLIFV